MDQQSATIKSTLAFTEEKEEVIHGKVASGWAKCNKSSKANGMEQTPQNTDFWGYVKVWSKEVGQGATP